VKIAFQNDNVTLWHGDCREVLASLSGVNLVFTSPPYNQNLQAFKPSGMHKESRWVERISSSYYDTMPESDYQEWQIAVCDAAWGACAPDASMFYNHKLRWRDSVPIFPTEWLLRTKWVMRQELIWARDGSVTQNARMFPPAEERIYWMRKDAWKWTRADTTWLSVWKIKSAANTEHPVAFPVELPTRAIVCCTEDGDTVLDPFCGSGTTLIAALETGRKAIGIEIDERWVTVARQRLERWHAQGRLDFGTANTKTTDAEGNP